MMVSLCKAILPLILIHLMPVFNDGSNQCRLNVQELQGIYKPGDIILGAILPLRVTSAKTYSFKERPSEVTCSVFLVDFFQHILSFMFTVDDINQNPNILPNLTLGFQWYDSCAVIPVSIAATLQALTGQNAAIPNYRCANNVPLGAFIGSASSTHSVVVATLLGLYRYPQISHYATSSLLSDKIRFPSFFRTVPSDVFQSQGLAKLLLHFDWPWIGLVATDNDYGQQGIQMIKREIVKAGACVEFLEYILPSRADFNAPRVAKTIKQSTAKVIVIFMNGVELGPLLDEMLKQTITGKIFVATDAWISILPQVIRQYSRLLAGTIGLGFYSGSMPGFLEYLNNIHPSMPVAGDLIKVFWELTFNCTFLPVKNTTSSSKKECTGEENIANVKSSYKDVSNLRITYNIYTAVYLVAKAIQDLVSCRKGEGSLLGAFCTDIQNVIPWQLLQYIRKARVTLSSGREHFFDENGDPPAVYDIVNWHLTPEGFLEHVTVGTYDTTEVSGQILKINTSSIFWATGERQVPRSVCSESCSPGFRKASIKGRPVCCFHCVPCPQGEVSNQTDAVDCLKCPWDQWSNTEKSGCVPKSIEYLSYEDPLGAALAVISVVSSLIPNCILKLFVWYKTTPIVRANNYAVSCLLLISLSLCFLCSLVFIGCPQHETCLLHQTTFGLIFALCISCILAKTLMVVFAFMATKPGSSLRKWTSPLVSYMIISVGSFLQFLLCLSWMMATPPFSMYNIDSKPGIIIIECNEGSSIAFWIMLGYLFLLATISFIVAFLARSLPDNFNEAKFITFSLLAFLSVWIAFIPASLSAQGKYTVAMEIFAILASSWGLVICMFFPKCVIIIFRPEMNSKENLLRKDKDQWDRSIQM